MRKLLRISAVLFFFLTLVITVNAQEEKESPAHKHGHMSDSASIAEFKSAMQNFNMEDFPFYKHRKKYNGHWAGVELGVSGYVTPSFDMNFGSSNAYLNMNTARSLTVNLNPFELNVNLYKNKIGFTTGLGFQITNYYFNDNYVILNDSATLTAYKVRDSQGKPVTLEVNKMVVSYLTLPLFFEYQTNPYRRISSFHVTLGAIAGIRIGSYTKQVYKDKGGSYTLVDDNGNSVATYSVDRYCVRDRGSYHLAPFKFDAAFRIGWSHLNLFATYSLSKLFQNNQGPEVYPFTVGLTLLGW